MSLTHTVFIRQIKATVKVLYKDTLPDVPLPPKPVITRWGTWLDAALFYFKYSCEMKEIMSKFDDSSSAAIKEAKKILNSPKLNQNLSFINNNYELIGVTLTKLEKQKFP